MSEMQNNRSFFLPRREFLGLSLLACVGCTSPLIRGQSPELEDLDVVAEKEGVLLVGDYCGSWGVNYHRLESIGLVTNLDDTGSDPQPSQARDILIGDMQGRGVKNPQKVLASPKISLVQVVAFLPPACQKGDPIDVMVQTPKKSETKSLRGGWLMMSRLRPLLAVNGRVKEGRDSGLAEGNLVIDAVFSGKSDPINEVRGRILGGGIAGESRHLGLKIRRDDVSIETTSVISAAVNQRFHTFDNGSKKGVAEPKDASFIKLLVPPTYKQNMLRYVEVVRSVPIREPAFQRAKRLEILEQKLFEPTTCVKASLQLESIGKEAIPVLKKGLKGKELETRFHAAEALAYLGDAECAAVLGEAAKAESAFRWSALTALSSMDHVHAYEQLTELLHVPSAESRYGAFRALRRRNAGDPLVRGESLRGQFSLHIIPTTGEPMIHISKSERAEIVLFGQDIPMGLPQGLNAGKQILLTSPDNEQIKISRFAPGEQDRVSYSAPKVDQLIRALVTIGATYGDVIQALHEAKQAGLITARIAVNAVPQPGQIYYKDPSVEKAAEYDEALDGLMTQPTSGPDEGSATGSDDDDDDAGETYVDPKYTPAAKKGVWSKMTGWFRSG